MEVIGDRQEVEARLLGDPSVQEEVAGFVLLAGQRVADPHHVGDDVPGAHLANVVA